MPYFTHSGNKLAMTLLAAGALAVGGTGVAAMADSLQDSPVAVAETESPSPTPTATDTESPEPTPTETDTESPEPTPTETEEPEPAPTETEEPEPEPTETEDPDDSPTSTPVGPDVTGPAAVGLCNAFANGGLNSTSTAYSVLLQAAGEEGIDGYCATIPAPGDADGTTDGDSGGEAPDSPQLEPQRHGPASNDGAGQQGNSAKHSGNGRR